MNKIRKGNALKYRLSVSEHSEYLQSVILIHATLHSHHRLIPHCSSCRLQLLHSLDQALHNVGYFYERDVRESTANLQVSMEVLLMMLLGGLILWIAISVLGPVYDIITKMKV